MQHFLHSSVNQSCADCRLLYDVRQVEYHSVTSTTLLTHQGQHTHSFTKSNCEPYLFKKRFGRLKIQVYFFLLSTIMIQDQRLCAPKVVSAEAGAGVVKYLSLGI